MKTSSTITTHELLRYCKEKKLDCLSNNVHDSCWKYSDEYLNARYDAKNRGLGKPWNICTIKDKLLQDQLEYIDHFYHTTLRFQRCCNDEMPAKPSIWHHFYLGDSQTREHMFQLMAKSFKFTMLRNPVDQFVSYLNFMKRMPIRIKYEAYVPVDVSLIELVDGCLANNSSLQRICRLATNMQSRVLGWDGKSSEQFALVLQFLDELDLVCLSEFVIDCWKLLKWKLNWPSGYFDTSKLRESSKHNVDSELEQKIKLIQNMDLKLYEHAAQIFEKKFRILA